MNDRSSIDVLWRDETAIAVSKPSGMPVHRSREHRDADVVLLQTVRDQIGRRVDPVHRLDRPTSGVVLLALSDTAAWVEALSTAEKRYVALVRGTLAATEVDRPLTNRTTGRKQEARTGFEPLGHVSLGDRFGAATLVSVRLYTGRRHQIRRHASHLRHQVLVDTTYGKGAINRYCRDELGFGRLCLHAASLSIAHPHTGAVIHIRDPWPDDLAAPLERLLPRSGWPPIL